MYPDKKPTASFWLRAALVATTQRMKAGWPLSLVPEGWMLRTGSYKWVCVWRNHPDAQKQLKVIVLPEPWSGRHAEVWRALLVHQMHALGQTEEMPDRAILAQAERHLFNQLAAPWNNCPDGETS